MSIICNSDGNEGRVQVWSYVDRKPTIVIHAPIGDQTRVIKISSLFADYRIQSNAQNTITVSLLSAPLLAALKSALTTDTEKVIMKLAKKNDVALLSFEILGTTSAGRRVSVGHDVRIEVMRPSEVDKLSEPMCPEPDVHIVLPGLGKMKTIVERMRPM